MTTRRIFLGFHAAAILALLVFYALAASDDGVVGANIGAGMAMLGLIFLGLPWSMPGFTVDSDQVQVAIGTAAALLNLVIHASLWWWADRRRSRRL